MTDLEATRLCAVAMGWKHLGAVGVPYVPYHTPDDAFWCLSGGNDWWLDPEGYRICGPCQGIPDPLHDDAQAMALVKRLRLDVQSLKEVQWLVSCPKRDALAEYVKDADLNRAIVYCVAAMQQAKNSAK